MVERGHRGHPRALQPRLGFVAPRPRDLLHARADRASTGPRLSRHPERPADRRLRQFGPQPRAAPRGTAARHRRSFTLPDRRPARRLQRPIHGRRSDARLLRARFLCAAHGFHRHPFHPDRTPFRPPQGAASLSHRMARGSLLFSAEQHAGADPHLPDFRARALDPRLCAADGREGVGRRPAVFGPICRHHVFDGRGAILGAPLLSPGALALAFSRRPPLGAGDGLDGRGAHALF